MARASAATGKVTRASAATGKTTRASAATGDAAGRRRWPALVGFVCAAAFLLAVGAAVGVGVEHHRSSNTGITQPSATDIGFAQDMSAHHDQAILMSRSLPASADIETRALAQRIIDSQVAEAATMRGWLTWFGAPQASEDPMSWMPSTSGHQHGASASTGGGDDRPMPGMASVAELTKLTEQTGKDASVFFLQLMIRHHQGGREMAQAAYNSADVSSTTKQLALSMIGDQGSEIAQMALMLTARGASPLTD